VKAANLIAHSHRYRAVLLALVCVLVAACAPRHSMPLRIGLIAFPGHEPLFLARSLGHLDERPIQLVELPSTLEVVRAYRSGLIDVAGLTGDEALTIAAQEPGQHVIVLVLDVSHGVDAMVAQPEFSTLTELRGKRIGFEPDALGAVMVARALETAGLTPADVVPVPVSLPDHIVAFTQRKVDAIVTFDPYCSRLIAQGSTRVFDTTHIPGEIVDVLITRRSAMDSHEPALRAAIGGWFRALEYLQQHPHDAAARMALREGVTPQQLLELLKGLRFPDAATNRRMLQPAPGNLAESLAGLAATMQRWNLLTQPIDAQQLLEDELLPGT
jgi:NitT/TauT family transport system substrate-binding protein